MMLLGQESIQRLTESQLVVAVIKMSDLHSCHMIFMIGLFQILMFGLVQVRTHWLHVYLDPWAWRSLWKPSKFSSSRGSIVQGQLCFVCTHKVFVDSHFSFNGIILFCPSANPFSFTFAIYQTHTNICIRKKTEETLGIRKVFVSHNLQWEFRWFRKYGKSVNFFDSVIGGLEM